ncbi:MAG: chemotaxis protein CheX [Sideroxydans sp.]|nr:chemotaxis protein CheX [Sideroxydans sp.]
MAHKTGTGRSRKKEETLADGNHPDIVIINALMDSLHTIFSTMMNSKVELGVPVPKSDKTVKDGVSALIGMKAEGSNGSVAISLPMPALGEISRKLLGHEITDINKDATDLAGELSNMLVGGAKRILSEKGMEFDMQTPQTMHGDGHEIEHHHGGQTVLLPVKVDQHEFFIELNFV